MIRYMLFITLFFLPNQLHTIPYEKDRKETTTPNTLNISDDDILNHIIHDKRLDKEPENLRQASWKITDYAKRLGSFIFVGFLIAQERFNSWWESLQKYLEKRKDEKK